MGGSRYSDDDMKARSFLRSSTAKTKGIDVNSATFAYDHDIKSGKTAAKVHSTLSSKGVKIRESRDSVTHPVTVPIAVCLDTTGSMQRVPSMIQGKLSSLMGAFLNDKTSGKKYLGDGYPAIMIAAVDDYRAMGSEGCLQIGQFESGIEIDDNLTNLWMTKQGGGSYEEDYDLFLYMLARKTVHDHWEKRGRKGYAFIIGDEKGYPKVSANIVESVIGDTLQADIPFKKIVKQAQERYHVFFITPNMTSNYGDKVLSDFWVPLLGQQNVISLDDPNKICECIVGAVAICENHIGIDDLSMDLGYDAKALVPLSKAGHDISRFSADGLVPVGGDSGGVTRL